VQFTQIRQFTSYGGGKLNFDVFWILCRIM
jgi:hypothetical protein